MSAASLAEIAGGPQAIPAALAIVRTFVDDARPRCAAPLAIVVEELVANMVEHGGATRIGIALSHAPGGVRLAMTDDGAAFDPRIAAAPGEHPPVRGGGAGLALVRAWTRDIDYAAAATGNRLTLIVPDA